MTIKTKKALKICAIVLAVVLIGATVGLIGAACARRSARIEPPTTAAPTPTASITTSPAQNWNERDVDVVNTINDFTFTVKGYYQFDRVNSRFECRVYAEEISAHLHYLQIDGYDFESFAGWKLSADGLYYAQNFAVIDGVKMVANYTAKAFTITFIDGRSGAQIGSYTASYGGAVKPPAPADYLADGYVFVEWTGGDYNNITRDTTLYASYAPARYITAIMPDGSKKTVAVALGSKLEDAPAPEIEDMTFKEWRHEDGSALAAGELATLDVKLRAEYDRQIMPQWLITTLIVIGSIAAAALILFIAFKIFRHYNKK